MEVMTAQLGIVFRRVKTMTRTPYFIGKAGHGDAKIIHLALLGSHEQAMRYVMNNQLDINRLALSNHHVFYDPKFELDALCNAIRMKRATRVQGERDRASSLKIGHGSSVTTRYAYHTRGTVID
jgi:hypothetical protein